MACCANLFVSSDVEYHQIECQLRVTRFVSLNFGYCEINSHRVFLQDRPCTCSSILHVPTKIGCLVVLAKILIYVICCLAFKMCLQFHLREMITHVPKKWIKEMISCVANKAKLCYDRNTRIWIPMWIPKTNDASVELLLDDQKIKTDCTNYNMERHTSSARSNSYKHMCDRETSSAIYCTLLHWKWLQTQKK